MKLNNHNLKLNLHGLEKYSNCFFPVVFVDQTFKPFTTLINNIFLESVKHIELGKKYGILAIWIELDMFIYLWKEDIPDYLFL